MVLPHLSETEPSQGGSVRMYQHALFVAFLFPHQPGFVLNHKQSTSAMMGDVWCGKGDPQTQIVNGNFTTDLMVLIMIAIPRACLPYTPSPAQTWQSLLVTAVA